MIRLWGRYGGWKNRACLVLISIVIFSLIAGCATYRTVKNAAVETVSGISGKGGRIKQKIALVPFANNTIWDENQSHTLFMKSLSAALAEKHPQILLVRPGDSQYPETLAPFFTPNTEKVDNIGMAKNCRDAGINGVITGRLNHIRAAEDQHGFFWFKKSKRVARIQVDVVMYHAGTAAKLIDETFSFDVDMVLADDDPISRRWVIDDAAMGGPLSDIAKTAAKTIGEKLKTVAWEGAVSSMDAGGKAVIPFGEISGLSIGDPLDVFDGGKTVSVPGGYRYIVPGLKIGEMKISAVFPAMAEALVSEGGQAIQAGSVVRLKK